MAEASAIIIDDEPGIVRLCKRLLERSGFTVQTFTNPEEGAEVLKNESFDVLLVDIRMPAMDGFQVIDIARQNQPDIAAVIMTGYGTLETAIRALRQGADGLILKPFEEGEELVKTVKDALTERQHKKEAARLRALRPLLDISETLFAETRRDTLLDLILNAIIGNMRCENAAIYQRRTDDSFLQLVGQRGNPLPEEHSRASAGLVGRADHWKVPIWVTTGGPGDPELQQILDQHNLGTVICSPVARGEQGVVFLAGRDAGRPGFQLGDLELFGLLARQADVALENARLYEELRAYVGQIEESQRALIQIEKMSAVGRLTASIAHEVNNPLQSVMNCLHLVGHAELEEEARNNYLVMAQEEMERLMSTMQRMLDFYRPGVLDREGVEANELIERVLALLEKQLSDNNIEVVRSFAKSLPTVMVVSNQIQQVFFNLILNAIDAMPEGGALAITSKQDKQAVEVYFQDEGKGVPEEVRAQLFEPFMSTREDGTGLGLSVSYGILTAHGGSLDLVPGTGRGACFRVILPLQEAL